MQQLGHADPGFTLRVYARVMRFSHEERGRHKALVEGREWAPLGTDDTSAGAARTNVIASESAEAMP
jgi:hypothetical protein